MALDTVSIVGLGKLGAPMAACLAARGIGVVGADTDPTRVAALADRHASVQEPGLEELLAAARGAIAATTDVAEAVARTSLTFIVVPTPSEPGGGFSLRHVLAACERIAAGLRTKQPSHVVVLTSTVMPGATGGEVRACLEAHSGRRCGVDFGLCYSPEFIALGSVINDFLAPDLVLIGESDETSGAVLAELYRRVCTNAPPVARMSLVNAELTKLALNTYVTTKITFANSLARLCERLPGGDVDAVTQALGLDSRIGGEYLRAATAYGGPCFPRDNLALLALARRLGVAADLAAATDRLNRAEIDRLADLVRDRLAPAGTVGLLGLAYKPHTDVVEESAAVLLARELVRDGIPVVGWDPLAGEKARCELGGGLALAKSAEECVARADLVVVMTPLPELRHLGSETFRRAGRRRVVIDCWRVLVRDAIAAVAEYVALGVGPPEPTRQPVATGVAGGHP